MQLVDTRENCVVNVGVNCVRFVCSSNCKCYVQAAAVWASRFHPLFACLLSCTMGDRRSHGGRSRRGRSSPRSRSRPVSLVARSSAARGARSRDRSPAAALAAPANSPRVDESQSPDRGARRPDGHEPSGREHRHRIKGLVSHLLSFRKESCLGFDSLQWQQ